MDPETVLKRLEKPSFVLGVVLALAGAALWYAIDRFEVVKDPTLRDYSALAAVGLCVIGLAIVLVFLMSLLQRLWASVWKARADKKWTEKEFNRLATDVRLMSPPEQLILFNMLQQPEGRERVTYLADVFMGLRSLGVIQVPAMTARLDNVIAWVNPVLFDRAEEVKGLLRAVFEHRYGHWSDDSVADGLKLEIEEAKRQANRRGMSF